MVPFPFNLADGVTDATKPETKSQAYLEAEKIVKNYNEGKVELNPIGLAIGSMWWGFVGYGIYKLASKK